MFKILTGERKRRTMSPTTFAASLAAHLLLLGGVLHAAGGEPPPREHVKIMDIGPVPEEPPAPPKEIVGPPPPPDAPPPPDNVLPVEGERLELDAPSEVPEGIAPEPPNLRPVHPDELRDGRPGDVIGTPQLEPLPLTGNPNPPPASNAEVIDASMAERQPMLQRAGLSRALERYYPPMLRDSRVQGTVLVELVVEANGRVRPGSAEIVEASHPAFGDAALRAVERFRFTPAEVGGMRIPVRVTVPISWSVPR